MTTLSVALVCADWPAETSGGATFEDDILRATLAMELPYRFVIYPDCNWTRRAVRDAGAEDRVTFVPALQVAPMTQRIWKRAQRAVLREPAPLPFAGLTLALRVAGAHCAWMLGGSLVPLDLPYIATIWDLQHRLQPWFPEVSADGEWRERESLYEEFVRRASAVVVGTATGATEVRDSYGEPAGGLHVIPLPTPAFALNAAGEPTPPRPPGLPARYVFYPAQFWAHKNHVTAVRALAQVRASGDTVELVLAGADHGTETHVMQLAEQLGVEQQVHSLGFVSRETLIALYCHAEALLYPSLFGPDNLPPLEAMALGCPVIAANVAGSEEQIGNAGLLVEGLNAEKFAEAIRMLSSNPALRALLVERGRTRASAWSTTQYAAAALDLIDTRIAPVRALWP